MEQLGDDIRVLAIGVDQSGWRTITPFLRQHNIRLPVAIADRPILHAFCLNDVPASVPQTFFFDRAGRLHARTSAALGEDDLIRTLRMLMQPNSVPDP